MTVGLIVFFVQTTDIASILMIAGASYIAWGVIDRTAGELTVS